MAAFPIYQLATFPLNPFREKGTFNTLFVLFFQGGGWVHSVSFSSDGNKLAWVGHDSSISVADATRDMATHKLKTQVKSIRVFI